MLCGLAGRLLPLLLALLLARVLLPMPLLAGLTCLHVVVAAPPVVAAHTTAVLEAINIVLVLGKGALLGMALLEGVLHHVVEGPVLQTHRQHVGVCCTVDVVDCLHVGEVHGQVLHLRRCGAQHLRCKLLEGLLELVLLDQDRKKLVGMVKPLHWKQDVVLLVGIAHLDLGLTHLT